MAHDADATGNPAPSPGTPVDARTDHIPVDRSVETTPQALYLWQIAVLEARLDAQQSRAERAERDRQHVIDRYEALLDDRRQAGELYTDGGRRATRSESASGSAAIRRALERVRSLF